MRIKHEHEQSGINTGWDISEETDCFRISQPIGGQCADH